MYACMEKNMAQWDTYKSAHDDTEHDMPAKHHPRNKMQTCRLQPEPTMECI